jgi:cytohesin
VNRWIATPLHTACSSGNKDIAELLIAKGADINARNKWDLTPLDAAIERGHDNVEELLLKFGAGGKNVGRTQLQRAAAIGDIDRVRLLLARGADIEARGDQYGNTALLYAAVRGHKEIVKLLLEKGANIEAEEGNGLTPLHLTVGYDDASHADVIQLLLDKGANIETRGYGDTTPIQSAVYYGNKKVAELLLAHGAKANASGSKFFGTAAHQAMRGNQKDMVSWSISKGVEIPPMHQAAYFGEIDKVRSSLGAGADINQKDIAKYTPLHCAVLGRNREIVQLLIENGADVNTRDCAYATPLFWACDRGYLDIVKLLVDNGAEVNTGAFRRLHWGPRLIDNYSNLHIAARVGHADVVEYLLVKGADIDAKCSRSNNEESTPLHLAVRAGHVEVVRHLLAKGANLKLKIKDGLTALDLAKQEKRTEIIKLLQSHGAKD